MCKSIFHRYPSVSRIVCHNQHVSWSASEEWHIPHPVSIGKIVMPDILPDMVVVHSAGSFEQHSQGEFFIMNFTSKPKHEHWISASWEGNHVLGVNNTVSVNIFIFNIARHIITESLNRALLNVIPVLKQSERLISTMHTGWKTGVEKIGIFKICLFPVLNFSITVCIIAPQGESYIIVDFLRKWNVSVRAKTFHSSDVPVWHIC